ncbi:MAG: hypothetical protein AABX25_05030 [Nanoarchaeota archaeon]
MEYIPVRLQVPLYGMTVRTPVDGRTTAVLENLTDDGFSEERLLSVLRAIREAGIRNVVVDIPKLPKGIPPSLLALPVLEGLTAGLGLNVRYIVQNPNDIGPGDDSFRRWVSPRIHGTLDEAVYKFILN